jgi:hypothetical protein
MFLFDFQRNSHIKLPKKRQISAAAISLTAIPVLLTEIETGIFACEYLIVLSFLVFPGLQ